MGTYYIQPYMVYQFQVYNIVIRHFKNLQSDHPDKSSTQPTLYEVIIILLTIFPMLFIPVTVFMSDNLCILISSLFSTIPATPLPSGNHQFVLCTFEFVSVLFILLFGFLDSTYK